MYHEGAEYDAILEVQMEAYQDMVGRQMLNDEPQEAAIQSWVRFCTLLLIAHHDKKKERHH